MKHIRYYGEPPYKVVLVHGGPGAAGEMAPVARELSRYYGVIEPFQTKYSVYDQIEELSSVISEHADYPVVLVGFSWGAWLTIMTAASYASLIAKIILIGCGPLEEIHAPRVFETRLNRLDVADKEKLYQVLYGLENDTLTDKNEALNELGEIMSNADTYRPIKEPHEPILVNGDIYKCVWREASEMRKSGKLVQLLNSITCPVEIIHGDYDPHPYDVVVKSVSSRIDNFRYHILSNCGHKPWIEELARQSFYAIIQESINSGLITPCR